MNWRLITLLADFGFLMGALATLGLTLNIEWLLWLLFWIVASFILAKNVNGRLFNHAFVVGLLASVFAALIEVVFFDMWSQHYPKISEAPFNPKIFLMVVSLFIGSISGLILSGLTLMNRKLLQLSPQK